MLIIIKIIVVFYFTIHFSVICSTAAESCVIVYEVVNIKISKKRSDFFFQINDELEFTSDKMVDCDDNSVIQMMPNSWIKITKDCKLVGNVCHNTTAILKPIQMSSVLFHRSVQLFNFTNQANCKELKKIKTQDVIKAIMKVNGLRDCTEIRLGVRCLNATLMKFNSTRRMISMVSHLAKVGDRLGFSSNIYFQGGRRSCMNFSFVVKKWNSDSEQ